MPKTTDKYTFLWSNAHQLFYMQGNIDSYLRYKYIPFNHADYVLQVSRGNKMTCYLGSEDLLRHVEEGKILLDYSFAENYFIKAKKQCADHQAFFQRLNKTNLSKQTNEQLLISWKELMDNYAHSVAYFRSSQEEPSRALVNKISKSVSLDELNTLLLSPELDDINKESVAWQKIVEGRFTRDKALIHLKNFPWLFQNILSYEETIDELQQRALKSSVRDIKGEKNKLRKAQTKILSKHPEIAREVDILQKLALLRPEVKSAWSATGFYATPVLAEIAKRFGEDIRTLTFLYRHEDIESLLETGKLLNKKDIADRKDCTAYVLEKGTLSNYVGKEAERVEERELGEERNAKDSQVLEIKGMCARPGKVKGIVHILSVNDPEAAKRFRKSFHKGILVTTMTQPNIVDIAERASAIVTDEGGMLSHAAIISREFGVPCIVGTHKATQILKDGDIVEVDANNGIVTILR